MRKNNMTRNFKSFILGLLLATTTVSLHAQERPLVNGSVFGGGRMANVEGNTNVTVNDCKAITAVYGGNDVAGEVQGNNGATVTIGTTNTDHEVIIGSVYGGGNGYYFYPNGVGTEVFTGSGNTMAAKSLAAGNVTGYTTADRSTVYATLTAAASVPSVKKTTVKVASDLVYIDSLFGGAKNAVISGSGLLNPTDTTVSIRVSAGTVFALFGGNNFGGFLAYNTTQHLSFSGTKLLNPNNSVNLGGDYTTGLAHTGATTAEWTNISDAHGIRYAFGGGNRVPGQNVHIEMLGGQIDTLFGGGNSATVLSAYVDVNVANDANGSVGPLYTYDQSPYDDTPTPYSINNSVFDVRCLFGGNNAADMTGLPTLNLTKGGIHNVYGGGNKGVMKADASWAAGAGIIAGTDASTKVLINSADIIIDTVYGGGQSAGADYNTYIIMTGGKVGTIFGGTNIQGTIANGYSSYVDVTGGDVYLAVYGGSNGLYRCVDDDYYLSGAANGAFAENAFANLATLEAPEIYNTNVHIGGTANIHRNVYGGGNMAHVGRPTSAATAGTTQVTIDGTPTFSTAELSQAAIFGGGNFANIFGTARTNISGSPVIYGNVYGGNDKTGTVTGVRDGGSYTTANNYTTTARTESQDFSSFLNYGMNGSTTTMTVKAPAAVTIQGTPQINGSVFGGGNGDYNYYHFTDAGTLENYTSNASLPWVNGRDVVLKCGMPPLPDQNGAIVDINVQQTGHIDYVFAGGNNATVGTAVSVNGHSYPRADLKPYLWFNADIDDADITADVTSGNNINVGTVFGGNNKAAMAVVPNLYFFKGKAGDIYGGGNLGEMTATTENLGSLLFNVGTYLGFPSQYFVVDHNVYGGCNVADVTKDTYVLLKRSTVLGDVFGGNDRSGEVPASHVIVDGDDLTLYGHVFGGSNGDYAFYRYDVDGEGRFFYKVEANSPIQYADASVTHPYIIGYKYNNGVDTIAANENRRLVIQYDDLKGRPYVGNANVEITGDGNVTFMKNVYGGGISGDCNTSHVTLDAPNSNFQGLVFGAGRGRVENIGCRIDGLSCHNYYYAVAYDFDASGNVLYHDVATTMGNVLDTAYLTVKQFGSMNLATSTMYGGGQNGSVANTVVNYENTATSRLRTLYLGCLASDVTETAAGIINAYEPTNGDVIIDTIYGGNDFSGRVQHTDLTVNSGIFTHLFGAGNGNYKYMEWINNGLTSGVTLGNELIMLNPESAPRIAVAGCYDTVPYSMQVDVTINGGTFKNTVYGGGNLGLVGNRDLDPDNVNPQMDWQHDPGSIILNIHGGRFNRHVYAGARGLSDMRGWYFTNGATDKTNVDGYRIGKQLVYGTKVVNMDGGIIDFSLYGGSEAVDDGFTYECAGQPFDNNKWYTTEEKYAYYSQNTSLRPSTVINITGGEVRKSLYGGGYQGNIYGSIYVNVGVDAVRDSKAWLWNHTYTAGTEDMTYFKPTITGYSQKIYTHQLNGSAVEKAVTNASYTAGASTGSLTCESGRNLTLGASIYNGSDWGEAGDKAYFNTRGVFGGVTNILVDGKQYNTSKSDDSKIGLPGMYIANSIIGAGTSTEGGDVNRLITIRHFGDYVCPGNVSMELYSIQRADKVVLDSVFINLKGENDAFIAYQTPSYAFNRIDTLIFQVDNIIVTEAPSIYVGNLVSMKTNEENREIGNALRLYDNKIVEGDDNDLFDAIWAPSGCDGSNNPCTQNIDLCSKLPTSRGQVGSVGAYNVLMFKNGSYMKIRPFIDKIYDIAATGHPQGSEGSDGHDDEIASHTYGHVYGYMYLLAEDDTKSYVYADHKIDGGTASTGITPHYNVTDGGFISLCACDNSYEDAAHNSEMGYTNVKFDGIDSYNYRTWTIGTNLGVRTRHITLVANATPDNILNWNLPAGSMDLYNLEQNATSSTTIPADFGYATATLELPPAAGGSFYVINSIMIDQDNGGQLSLVDQGYVMVDDDVLQTTNGALTNLNNIAASPNYTFGLSFSSHGYGSNFADGAWNTNSSGHSFVETITTDDFTRQLGNGTVAGGDFDPYRAWPQTLLSGNSYITQAGGYISNAVSAGEGIIPNLTFTLTYSKKIRETITRDVVFTMHEFKDNGDGTATYVGPVEVTVTISTVIKDFDDIEAPVLAMYNEGIYDEYVRKISIPASFHQRDLYIEGISWQKDNITPDGIYTVYQDPDKTTWFVMNDANGIPDSNNKFGFTFNPTEAISEGSNSTLGWYHIAGNDLDILDLALKGLQNMDGHESDSFSWSDKTEYNSISSAAAGTDTILGTNATFIGDNKDPKGLWVGTLDGRATSSIDIGLHFDGDRIYQDQFDIPLAWITLRMHWYNTKTEGDGTFDIRIKLRTRDWGDTIYLCPDPTITRKPDGSADSYAGITLKSYEQQRIDNDGADASNVYAQIDLDAAEIRNHPKNYLQSFKAAMLIYREGDVLDVIKTMPISAGDDPITLIGDDYSTIQIIRYSGSHFEFPSLGCANYDPMIDVNNNGILTMRNVWINGSGCTRVKVGESLAAAPDDKVGENWNANVAGLGAGTYWLPSALRTNTLLFSDAPALLIRGGGNVTFSTRVRISNNFNHSKNTDADHYDVDQANVDKLCGGAVALIKDIDSKTPQLTLGDGSLFYDNVVVDWNKATTSGTTPVLPLNYGGGVYIDGGRLQLGGGAEGISININRNFYLLSEATEGMGIIEKTIKAMDNNVAHDKTFQIYALDTANDAGIVHATNFSLSNVYLTRTVTDPVCPDEVRRDEQSDVIYFLSKLSATSRVGVSKWFPGYLYYNASHRFYNEIPRDTIGIARAANANATLTEHVYDNKVFFNDSAYFSSNVVGATPSFYMPTDANSKTTSEVTYSGNSTDNPNYDDRVFVFSNSMVSPYNIYFQRCASFRKGTVPTLDDATCLTSNGINLNKFNPGDSLSYHFNPSSICFASTDTVFFNVGGGFFPYTYTWYNTTSGSDDKLRSRQTTGSNVIADLNNSDYATLRYNAQYDTLVLRDITVPVGSLVNDYSYRVEALDMTGNCPLVQNINIRVAKTVDNTPFVDADNYLGHGTAYTISSPGVDSTNFHDHAGYVSTQSRGAAVTDAKYLRIYSAYNIHPRLAPVDAQASGSGIYDGVSIYAAADDAHADPLAPTDEYCPGDVVTLVAQPKNSSYDFIAWDFDPSAGETASFIVSTNSYENYPTAYYSPGDYWWQNITKFQNDHNTPADEYTATLDDYELDYYGNVTIHTNKGLAWLISTVNGYNGQDAHSFLNNTVTLEKDVVFDMGAHKWTPLGNENNPFRGTFKSQYTDDVRNYDFAVPVVQNLIVNENTIPLVGMFGYTQSADIKGFYVQDAVMKGNSYVGTVAAETKGQSNVVNIGVKSATLFGEYIVGGLVATTEDQTVIDSISLGSVTMIGNTIYAGGTVGVQSGRSVIQNGGVLNENDSTGNNNPNNPNDTIGNGNNGKSLLKAAAKAARDLYNYTPAINIKQLNTIYWGGISNVDNLSKKGRRGAKDDNNAVIRNCYVSVISGDGVQKGGGLVGRANNVVIENSYAHGSVKSSQYLGGLVGYMGDNVSLSNCYYVEGMADDIIGYNTSGAPATKSTTFSGRGHNVILHERVDGYNNMIRALNAWVRRNGSDTYRSWAPDLAGSNNGYPVFGNEVMIQVRDTVSAVACGEYDFDGITFDQSGNYVFHIVDSADYLDSTMTLVLTINHGDTVYFYDTVTIGQGYDANGFSISSEDISSNLNDRRDIRTMQFVDNLVNHNGCDSLRILTLYVVGNGVGNDVVPQKLIDVKLYPNPTRGIVNVEGSDLRSIEVYDNVSRQVLHRKVEGDKATFDLSNHASGAYYVRIMTANGTVVKKVIKK